MKMYKKSDLTLINGMLVSKDSDVIAVDPRIVKQANELDTLVQKAEYLKLQPSAQPMPSLDGFERKSEHNEGKPYFVADTPILNAQADEAMDIMAELDDMDTTKKANEMLDMFSELVQFTINDYVIGGDGIVEAFDTPVLGNILELTCEEISLAVAYINGMTKEDDIDINLKPIRSAVVGVEDMDKVMEFFNKLESKESEDDKPAEDTEE